MYDAEFKTCNQLDFIKYNNKFFHPHCNYKICKHIFFNYLLVFSEHILVALFLFLVSIVL